MDPHQLQQQQTGYIIVAPAAVVGSQQLSPGGLALRPLEVRGPGDEGDYIEGRGEKRAVRLENILTRARGDRGEAAGVGGGSGGQRPLLTRFGKRDPDKRLLADFLTRPGKITM